MPPRKIVAELVISSEPEAGAAVVEVVRRGLYAFNTRATGLASGSEVITRPASSSLWCFKAAPARRL